MYADNIFLSNHKVFNMRERYCRIIIILFAALIMDLIRPLGYSLSAEFLFLAAVALFLTYPYFPALVWGGIFGYFKDILSSSNAPITLMEFFFIFMLIRFFLYRLHSRVAKTAITAAIIIVHVVINNLYVKNGNIVFYLLFFIQTFLLFFPVNYLVRKWMKLSSGGYI